MPKPAAHPRRAVVMHQLPSWFVIAALLSPAQQAHAQAVHIHSLGVRLTGWMILVGLGLTAVWICLYVLTRVFATDPEVLESAPEPLPGQLQGQLQNKPQEKPDDAKPAAETLSGTPSETEMTPILFDRETILSILGREMLRSVRNREPLGVVLVGLHQPDPTPEQPEHALTPEDTASLLRQLAVRLLEITRGYDVLGHYSEEAFLVLLPGWDPDAAPQRASSILIAIAERPFEVAGQPMHLAPSLGIASYNPLSDSPYAEELLHRATEAMESSRSAGSSAVVIAAH